MKFFSLINGGSIHMTHKRKVIPQKEFATALEASELLIKVKADEQHYREEVASECETIKQVAVNEGFEEGLTQWNSRLKDLELEIEKVRRDMQESLVPLAMAAIKKIIGREIELKQETIVDIIATSLKAVSHHRKITIYVHKNDLELVEKHKPQLKALFENVQSFTIATREELEPGQCTIETEAGIINASWEHQLKALESAFHSFLHTQEKGGA